MPKSMETQLMFTGCAREALELYVKTFDGAVLDAVHYPSDHPSQAGQIQRAVFELCGQRFACMHSEDVHDFSFTPSISVFVEMESASELQRVYDVLAEEGSVLMPMDNYGFSEQFVWFNDRYGVSWQLNYGST